MYNKLVTNFLRFVVQYLQSRHQLFSTDLWLISRHDSIADVTLWNFHTSFFPLHTVAEEWEKMTAGFRQVKVSLGKGFCPYNFIWSECDSVLVSSSAFLSNASRCTFLSIHWYICASTTVGVRKCYTAQKNEVP